MSKPKILYILHCYFNTAGTEEHTRLLSRHLAHSYDCSIVAPHGNSIVLIEGGQVVKEFPIVPIGWPIAASDSPLHTKALRQIVEMVKPSLIHIQHTMNWHLGVVDDVTSFGIPTTMSFHDYFHITPHYTMQGVEDPRVTLGPNYSKLYFGSDITEYLKRRRDIFTSAFAKISSKVVPSQYLANVLTKIFPSKYSVIEHGIEPFVVSGDSPTEVVFGYIGSLLPQKGYSVLLEAFQQLVYERAEATLHVFGGGAQGSLPSIRGVTYHGGYRWEDLSTLLPKFSVGIIPSVFAETFCLTLSELWMGKKAVLASNIGALAERIQDDVQGKLFAAGNVESLYTTMKRCFETPVWKRWQPGTVKTAEMMAKDYENLYRCMIGQ